MTDSDFLLQVLRDGRWHGLNEILGRSQADRGCGLTVHSRAADLRKRGLVVHQESRPGPGGRVASFYRLLGETAGGERVVPSPAAASPSSPPNPVGDDGEQGAPRDGGQLVLHIPRNAYERAA